MNYSTPVAASLGRGNSIGQTGEVPKPVPAIQRSLAELAESVDQLEKAMSELNSRLTPVLSPHVTEPGDEKDPSCPVPLAEVIDQMRRRVRAVAIRMYETSNSIQL